MAVAIKALFQETLLPRHMRLESFESLPEKLPVAQIHGDLQPAPQPALVPQIDSERLAQRLIEPAGQSLVWRLARHCLGDIERPLHQRWKRPRIGSVTQE